LEFGCTSFIAYNELKAGTTDKRANDFQPEDLKGYDTGGKSIEGKKKAALIRVLS